MIVPLILFPSVTQYNLTTLFGLRMRPIRVDSFMLPSGQCLTMKTSRFLLRGFRRPREIACFALGKLERQGLEETWRIGEVSVREIYRAFEEPTAYTTLMTTLDRLFKKNLLERRKDGRAFLYSALVSRDDLDRGIKEDVVNGLLGQ